MPQKSSKKLLLNIACLLVCGLGVGWLIGLSVSSLLYLVITSLMSIIAGLAGALAGLEMPSEKEAPTTPTPKRMIQLDPVPLTAFILGLVLGASTGVYARTNQFFGPNIDKLAEKWKATEYTKRDIARVLFAQIHGTPAQSPVESPPPTSEPGSGTGVDPTSSPAPAGGDPQKKNNGKVKSDSTPVTANTATAGTFMGVLFSISEDERARICSASNSSLNAILSTTSDANLNQQARACDGNIECLRKLKEAACAKR